MIDDSAKIQSVYDVIVSFTVSGLPFAYLGRMNQVRYDYNCEIFPGDTRAHEGTRASTFVSSWFS